MLSSFGIDARYPYLTNEMIEFGAKSCNLNRVKKEFHVEQCLKMLPPAIAQLVGKHGGTTDVESFFPSDLDIFTEIQKMKYYSPNQYFNGYSTLKNLMYQYYLSLLCVESFEKQFCDSK